MSKATSRESPTGICKIPSYTCGRSHPPPQALLFGTQFRNAGRGKGEEGREGRIWWSEKGVVGRNRGEGGRRRWNFPARVFEGKFCVCFFRCGVRHYVSSRRLSFATKVARANQAGFYSGSRWREMTSMPLNCVKFAFFCGKMVFEYVILYEKYKIILYKYLIIHYCISNSA